MRVLPVSTTQPLPSYLRVIEEEYGLDPYSLDGLNSEAILVHIARASSSRQDKTEEPEKLINYLIDNNHWSPFEHTFLTFEIVTTRAIGRQILRHRSHTFQEFSQRYAEVEVLEPFELRQQAEKNRQSSTDLIGVADVESQRDGRDEHLIEGLIPGLVGVRHMGGLVGGAGSPYDQIDMISAMEKYLEIGRRIYKKAVASGIAKECARMILPGCAQTKLYDTASLRSWIHYFDLRDDAHAQKEVREIALLQKAAFIELFPLVSKARGYVIG